MLYLCFYSHKEEQAMTKENSSPTVRKKYSAAIPWSERNLRLKLAGVIGVTWTIYIIMSLFNVFFYLGIVIFPITHRAIRLATPREDSILLDAR